MPRKHMPALVLLAAASLLATASITTAGDINPPAGPVAATMKPLNEVEPRIAISATNTPGDADALFKITQRGSYYLTGNIAGVANKHGIEITVSNVKLDLSGFTLTGAPGAGALDGVSVTADLLTDITVVNGSVRNWNQSGVDFGTHDAINCRALRIGAVGNGAYGILGGTLTTIAQCTASGNGAAGIAVYTGGVVSGCTAYSNSLDGISAGDSSSVTACTAYANASNGIGTGTGCSVSACAAADNSSYGFFVGNACSLSHCSAYENDSSGIFADVGSIVTECSAQGNTVDGIRCTSQCHIRNNSCSFNGSQSGNGAGVHASGADNRIEGNNCTFADRGIDVDLAGNIIIRNTCSGNTTDWDIAGNNVYGPIIDRRAPAAAPVNGFSAVGSLATTDPNANFSY